MDRQPGGHNSGISAGGDIGHIGNISDSFNPVHGEPTARPAGESLGAPGPQRRADVGVLTVLPQETHAMVSVFRQADDYHQRTLPDRSRVHEATFRTPSGPLDAVLLQTLDRGQRSATAAYARLRRWYAPPIVALVGIAGGISSRLDVGDVVLADQIIYYDERRETAEGTRWRGESTVLTAAMTIAVNDLFSTEGEPLTIPSPERDGTFRVARGPLGSGSAVITDEHSRIRRFLQEFHEKCLAVETESGGLVQGFREEYADATGVLGWLVLRGISDHADAAKGHRDHDVAARHAAAAFHRVLPYLWDARK
ncbi:phosphorylase family protein [Micromonospora coxensis]|uniref:5'-methylthioadenosine/S-adenosylhomocysteine nucleosidase family protein n=1 Tax=Micromonospora coxensis TaxID=356852 RepID=UPI00341425D4